MKIIEIDALPNGAHNNQFTESAVEIPAGWVIIPDDMEIPESFPFVTFHYRKGVVTDMSPAPVPPPEPEPEPEPSADDVINALLGVANA